MSELLLGGVAACCACFFTNPFEVIKTRVQLQGELKARGQYHVVYRNVFHAFYSVATTERLVSLQKGLIPATWYQFFMNGIRLGVYQCCDNLGLLRNKQNEVVFLNSIIYGAVSGIAGAVVASPLYMVKIQLQSKAAIPDPVGHQHNIQSMTQAFRQIYLTQGLSGLWRGFQSSAARVAVGSAVQLTTFSKIQDAFNEKQLFTRDSYIGLFCASTITGIAVTAAMTPFDVVATRLYNQPVINESNKGLYYSGIMDCMIKMFKTEGFFGFYKGWAAAFLRIGPHSVLSLMFWRKLRQFYFEVNVPAQTREVS
ncbi:solute carrier family 25 member 35-like protein [Leptotrombidium deliense]|uniref:Solute carrier family 25 member 35-like protein n=1 Tax=Leptotrombidium deliense TaxID=299467 RepID=A0A443ST88_9ACAR|nr:solute carrier family 25 member 35-like protein [Leptotrombidium deliense]